MRNLHVEDVWNTVVTIECELESISYKDSIDFLHLVDQLFSTYLPDSQVSKLRRGEIEIAEADQLVQQVWQACLEIREVSDGAFDPTLDNASPVSPTLDNTLTPSRAVPAPPDNMKIARLPTPFPN